MRALSKAMAGAIPLMAQEDKTRHAGGGNGPLAGEASLADGTGEGNVPIDGTSASSDPDVLAGIDGEPGMTFLNEDDYPDDIADAGGAVDDGRQEEGLAGAGTDSDRQAPRNGDRTAGQATLPDTAAGVRDRIEARGADGA